jgi:uncharacterized Zn finger protein
MSEIRTFFRFCPGCGRRFHIRLVTKELVAERKETTETKQTIVPAILTPGVKYYNPIVIEQNVPTTIDVEEFQYTYKCKHCGHVWSELRLEDSKV